MAHSDNSRMLMVVRGLLLAIGLLYPLHVPYSLGTAADAEKALGWWADRSSPHEHAEPVVVRTLSHASNSGLLPGDVILQLNGDVATMDRLHTFRRAAQAGDAAQLTISRDGAISHLSIPVRESSPSYAGYRWYRFGLAMLAWLVGMGILAWRGSTVESLLLGGALLLIGPVTMPIVFADGNTVLRMGNFVWHFMGGIYRFLLPVALLLFFVLQSSKRSIVRSRAVVTILAVATVIVGALISDGFTRPLAWTSPGFASRARAAAGLTAEIAAVIAALWIGRDVRKMASAIRWLGFASLLVLVSGAVLSTAMIAAPGRPELLDALRQIKALTLALLPIAAGLYAFLPGSTEPADDWYARERASAAVSIFLTILYGCAVAGAAAIALSVNGLSLGGAELALFGAIFVATIVFAPVLRWSREMVERHVFASWMTLEQNAHALVQELNGDLEPHKIAERLRRTLPDILDVADVRLVLVEEIIRRDAAASDSTVFQESRDLLERRLTTLQDENGRRAEAVRRPTGELMGLLEYTPIPERSVLAPPERKALSAIVRGVAVALRNTESYFELRRANQALSENERVTSLAVMAGGLAHEIKNPLASLKMGLYLLRRESQDHNRLVRIEGDVRRIDDLVSSLLRFTHTANPEMREPIELCGALHSIVADLESLARDRDIRVEEVYGTEAATIMAGASEIRVLFSSIVHNALDACSAGGVVRLCINTHPDEIEVVIQDDGHGIPSDLQRRVFDLNFSTKTGGSGLGLALARREAERLGGRIDLESDSENGTTLRVILPAAEPIMAARLV